MRAFLSRKTTWNSSLMAVTTCAEAFSVFTPKNLCPPSGDPKTYPKARPSEPSWAMKLTLCTGWWYTQS